MNEENMTKEGLMSQIETLRTQLATAADDAKGAIESEIAQLEGKLANMDMPEEGAPQA